MTDHGYSQSRTTLVTTRALSEAGYRPAVTQTDRWSLAAASRHAAARLRLPPGGGARYAEAIRRELLTHDYVTVMPTSDAAMVALDAPVAHLLDKRSLATAAVAVGLATPPTREFNDRAELAAAAPDLDYPLVVKPAVSRFSPFRADGPEGLHLDRLVDCPLLVQPFIVDGLRAVSGVIWAGRLVAASHQRYIRTWPPDCGGASMAESVPPDLELEGRVVAILSSHEGLFMAQFAGPYLLDLNPRPYGSLPLAVAAGANLPALYCDLVLGCEPPARPVRARPGVRYRWLEGDLRSIGRHLRRGSMSLRSAVHELARGADRGATVETWRDPGPAGLRLAYAASHRPR